MTRLDIHDRQLTLRLTGLDKLWALKSSLRVPLDHIRSVRAYDRPRLAPQGLRFPGTYLPGVIAAGTVVHGEARVFWNVRHPDRALIIDLAAGDYTQLIVEVQDREAALGLLAEHLGATQPGNARLPAAGPVGFRPPV